MSLWLFLEGPSAFNRFSKGAHSPQTDRSYCCKYMCSRLEPHFSFRNGFQLQPQERSRKSTYIGRKIGHLSHPLRSRFDDASLWSRLLARERVPQQRADSRFQTITMTRGRGRGGPAQRSLRGAALRRHLTRREGRGCVSEAAAIRAGKAQHFPPASLF